MSKLSDVTFHDVGRVSVVVDRVNGCIQVIGYNSLHAGWPDFTLTMFAEGDSPPELEPTTYLEPDVPSLDEAIAEYENKHGE